MEDKQFDAIYKQVQTETLNRSHGSFKRALWYGHGTRFFGQHKGLRKNIRNAPRKAAGAVISIGVGAGLGSVHVGFLSELIMPVIDELATAGKEIYSGHVKALIKHNWSMTNAEGLRKRIKSSMKDMKANAFQTIDRNIVKLKYANKKVAPAIGQMNNLVNYMASSTFRMGLAPSEQTPAALSKPVAEAAHSALRAIAETQYYIDKTVTLITVLRIALVNLQEDLEKVKTKAVRTEQDIIGIIKEHL